MRVLGSMNTGAAGGNDSFLCESWNKDMAGDGIMLDIQMPVVVGVAGSPATSDLVNLLKYFISALTIAYGPSQEFEAILGIPGDELRSIFRFLSMKEVANNFVGVAQTAAAHTFGVQLVYLFSHPTMRGRKRRPGYSQCRTIRIDVTEGANLTAGALNLSRGAGNCVINVVPIYRAGPDNFVHLPHYRRVNQSRLEADSPDGLVLGAWDANAAFGSTAITKFSTKVGDKTVDTTIPPLYVNDEYSRLIDAGGSNMTDTATLVYFGSPFGDIDELPAGDLQFILVSQDVPTIELRVVYYPPITEDQTKAMTEHVAAKENRPVLASTHEVAASADPGAAATAPVELIPPSDDRFQAHPGVLATPGGTATLSVPPQTVASVNALAGVAGANKQAVASVAQRQVMQRIPGAISTRGKSQGGANARTGVRSVFSHLFRAA